MIDKHTKRLIGRKIGFFFLKLFAFLTEGLPLWWSYFVGWMAGKIFYRFVARYRSVALESLAIAFPHISQRERTAIAKQSIIIMIQGGLELLYCVKQRAFLDSITIEGKHHLDEALKQGKGVIGITAHFGNFPVMTVKFAREGYATNAMARPMRDPEIGDFIFNLRKTFGIKTIFSYPRKEVVTKTLKALRNNELVLIQMDQNFGTGGVWVDFFGKLAATPTGPIVFGLRTGAVMLPIFMRREGRGRHYIEILPPPSLEVTSDKDETVLLNVAKFSKIIEQKIREHPAQWGWIHRRWKSRPSEQAMKEKYTVQQLYRPTH